MRPATAPELGSTCVRPATAPKVDNGSGRKEPTECLMTGRLCTAEVDCCPKTVLFQLVLKSDQTVCTQIQNVFRELPSV